MYRDSVFDPDNCDAGFFSLKYQWEDKPHRHVADLSKYPKAKAVGFLAKNRDWVNALQDKIKRLRDDKT